MERAKGRKEATPSPPEGPRGTAGGAEASAAPTTHSALLAAVRQLTAARLAVLAARTEAGQAGPAHARHDAYVVCPRAPPFLGLLCALFPEHEFHVYDPAPELPVRPYGQGRREMPAWLYRHELLQADITYWARREGDTVVFLGEAFSPPGESAEDLLADKILGDQCQRRCGRCAMEIRTWLAYVRSGPASRQNDAATSARAVTALMARGAAVLKEPRPCRSNAGHGACEAKTLEAASPRAQTKPGLPEPRPSRAAPPNEVRQSAQAAERPPPTANVEEDPEEPTDWERLSAEMLGPHKKAAAPKGRKGERGGLERGPGGRAPRGR